MHEEPQRRLIKIADCDEVPWLQIRLRSVDPVNDKEKRLALADVTAPITVAGQPASWPPVSIELEMKWTDPSPKTAGP